MGELEDRLNSILSSPEEMEKIMGLARSLSQDGFGSNSNERQAPPNMGGIDPNQISRLMGLMGKMNTGSDKAGLIRDMKPYLKKERRQKLDEAVRLAQMAKLAKIAFSEFSGGDKDV